MLPLQGAQVQSLLGKLRSLMPSNMAKIKKPRKTLTENIKLKKNVFFKKRFNGSINKLQCISLFGFLLKQGFPGGTVIKNLPANAGGTGSIPGLGRSPGEGNGTPHQYSCLGNPMDRRACCATVYGVAKSQT